MKDSLIVFGCLRSSSEFGYRIFTTNELRESMKRISWTIAIVACMILSSARLFAQDGVPLSIHSTYSLNPNCLTLEVDLPPEALLRAGLIEDSDADGKISLHELHQSHQAVLSHLERKLSVWLNGRNLKSDSSFITYKFLSGEELPERVVVSCRFAVLLKPGHFELRNELVDPNDLIARNEGTFQHAGQTVSFEFRHNSNGVVPPVNLEISGTQMSLIPVSDGTLQPALIWLAAGLGGLALFGTASRVRRKLARRAQKKKMAQPRTANLPTEHSFSTLSMKRERLEAHSIAE